MREERFSSKGHALEIAMKTSHESKYKSKADAAGK